MQEVFTIFCGSCRAGVTLILSAFSMKTAHILIVRIQIHASMIAAQMMTETNVKVLTYVSGMEIFRRLKS